MKWKETTLKEKLLKYKIVLDVYSCLNLTSDKGKWEIIAKEKDYFINKKEGEENWYTRKIVWEKCGWQERANKGDNSFGYSKERERNNIVLDFVYFLLEFAIWQI